LNRPFIRKNRAMRPPRGYNRVSKKFETLPQYVSCPKSWIGSISSIPADFVNYLYITPYLANKIHLSSLDPHPVRVLTLRPAQGQQSEGVFLDFVRPRFSRFLTNSQMVVAMSRFITKFVIPWVPHLPYQLELIFHGYYFESSLPLRDNYLNFVTHFEKRFPSFKSQKQYEWVRPFDHNGNFFLKWWFFLAFVEYTLSLNLCLPYDREFTCFACLARKSQPSDPNCDFECYDEDAAKDDYPVVDGHLDVSSYKCKFGELCGDVKTDVCYLISTYGSLTSHEIVILLTRDPFYVESFNSKMITEAIAVYSKHGLIRMNRDSRFYYVSSLTHTSPVFKGGFLDVDSYTCDIGELSGIPINDIDSILLHYGPLTGDDIVKLFTKDFVYSDASDQSLIREVLLEMLEDEQVFYDKETSRYSSIFRV